MPIAPLPLHSNDLEESKGEIALAKRLHPIVSLPSCTLSGVGQPGVSQFAVDQAGVSQATRHEQSRPRKPSLS